MIRLSHMSTSLIRCGTWVLNASDLKYTVQSRRSPEFGDHAQIGYEVRLKSSIASELVVEIVSGKSAICLDGG
jgi:hypothetical protein